MDDAPIAARGAYDLSQLDDSSFPSKPRTASGFRAVQDQSEVPIAAAAAAAVGPAVDAESEHSAPSPPPSPPPPRPAPANHETSASATTRRTVAPRVSRQAAVKPVEQSVPVSPKRSTPTSAALSSAASPQQPSRTTAAADNDDDDDDDDGDIEMSAPVTSSPSDERPLTSARGAYDLSNLDDTVFPSATATAAFPSGRGRGLAHSPVTGAKPRPADELVVSTSSPVLSRSPLSLSSSSAAAVAALPSSPRDEAMTVERGNSTDPHPSESLAWADRFASPDATARRIAFEAVARSLQATASATPTATTTTTIPTTLLDALSDDVIKRMATDSVALVQAAGASALAALASHHPPDSDGGATRSADRFTGETATGYGVSVVLRSLANLGAAIADPLVRKGLTQVKSTAAAAAETAIQHTISVAPGSVAAVLIPPLLAVARDTKRPRAVPAALRCLAAAFSSPTRAEGAAAHLPVTGARASRVTAADLRSVDCSVDDVLAVVPNLLLHTPGAAPTAGTGAASAGADSGGGTARAAAALAAAVGLAFPRNLDKMLASQSGPGWETARRLIDEARAAVGSGAAAASTTEAATSVSAGAATAASAGAGTSTGPLAWVADAMPLDEWSATHEGAAPDAAVTRVTEPLATALAGRAWAEKSEALDRADKVVTAAAPRIALSSAVEELVSLLIAKGLPDTHPGVFGRSASLVASIAARTRAAFRHTAAHSALPALLLRLRDSKHAVVDAAIAASVALWRFSCRWDAGVRDAITATIDAATTAKLPLVRAGAYRVIEAALAEPTHEAITDAEVASRDAAGTAATVAALLERGCCTDTSIEPRSAAESAMVALLRRLAASSPPAADPLTANPRIAAVLKKIEKAADKSYRRIVAALSPAAPAPAPVPAPVAPVAVPAVPSAVSLPAKAAPSAAAPVPPRASGASAGRRVGEQDMFGPSIPAADDAEAALLSCVPEGAFAPSVLEAIEKADKWQDRVVAIERAVDLLRRCAPADGGAAATAFCGVLRARTGKYKHLSNANLLAAVLRAVRTAVCLAAALDDSVADDTDAVAAPRTASGGWSSAATAAPFPRAAAAALLSELAVPRLKEQRKGGAEASRLVVALAAACGPPFVLRELCATARAEKVPAVVASIHDVIIAIVGAYGARRLGGARDAVITLALSPATGLAHPKPVLREPATRLLIALQAQTGPSILRRLMTAVTATPVQPARRAAGEATDPLPAPVEKSLEAQLEAAATAPGAVPAPALAPADEAYVRSEVDPVAASTVASSARTSAAAAAAATSSAAPAATTGATKRVARHGGASASASATSAPEDDSGMTAADPSAMLGLELPRQPLRNLIPPATLGRMGTVDAGGEKASASGSGAASGAGGPKPWQQREAALIEAKDALDRAGPAGADVEPLAYAKEVVRGVVARFADTNGNLRPRAADLVACLAVACGPRVMAERFARLIVPGLAEMSGDKKSQISSAALRALTALTTNPAVLAACTTPVAINQVLSSPATTHADPIAVDAVVNAIVAAESLIAPSAGPIMMAWLADRLSTMIARQASAVTLRPCAAPAVGSLAAKAADARAAALRLVTQIARHGARAAVSEAVALLKQGVRLQVEPFVAKALEAAASSGDSGAEATPATEFELEAAPTMASTSRTPAKGTSTAGAAAAAPAAASRRTTSASTASLAATGRAGGARPATGVAGLAATTAGVRRAGAAGSSTAPTSGPASAGPDTRLVLSMPHPSSSKPERLRRARAFLPSAAMVAGGGAGGSGGGGSSGSGSASSTAGGLDLGASSAEATLKADWIAAGALASPELLRLMFSTSSVAHTEQEAALTFLRESIATATEVVLEASDLIWRYAALRLFAAKTNVLTAAQKLALDLIAFYQGAGLTLSPQEAALVIPAVADQCGAIRAAVRDTYRQLLAGLAEIMGTKAFVRAVLTGLPEQRNLRSVADCLSAAGNALEAAQGRLSPAAVLARDGIRIVATFLGSSNAEVRDAALAALRPLWVEASGSVQAVVVTLGGAEALGQKALGILEGRAKEWARATPIVPAPPSAAAPVAATATAAAASSTSAIPSAGPSRIARRGGATAASSASTGVGKKALPTSAVVAGPRAAEPPAAPPSLPGAAGGASSVGEFLSEIEAWVANVEPLPQARVAASTTGTAAPASPGASRRSVGPGRAQRGAPAASDVLLSDATGLDDDFAHLPATPGRGGAAAAVATLAQTPSGGRNRRRETNLHINSNEIRRALGRTAAESADSSGSTATGVVAGDPQGPQNGVHAATVGRAAGSHTRSDSPMSTGSDDSTLAGELLGSRAGNRRGRSDDADRRQSLLSASVLGASAVRAVSTAAVPSWLQTLHTDILAAAFLFERSRRAGVHSAVIDAEKYARGLTAIATLHQRIKAIPPDTTLPSPSPGKMVAAGASESDLEILSRASSMIVKAATTLLTHAFGGAVRPVPASPSGTPTAATSSTASMILSPVAGSAAAGSGPDFRSDGTVDAGYVSGTVALLLDLFIRPALGGSVTDKSLNALFQECMLRVADSNAPTKQKESLTRLVMRVVHRARRDSCLVALIDLLARARAFTAVDSAASTPAASSAGSAAGDEFGSAAAALGRTPMPVKTMINVARLIGKCIGQERGIAATGTAAISSSPSGAIRAATPYGGLFDIGAVLFSLHQFLTSHADEVAACAAGEAGFASVGKSAPHVPAYAVALPVRACLGVLRDIVTFRTVDAWNILDGMVVVPESGSLASAAAAAAGVDLAESPITAESVSADQIAGLSQLGRAALAAEMPVERSSVLLCVMLRYTLLQHRSVAVPSLSSATTTAAATGSATSVAAALRGRAALEALISASMAMSGGSFSLADAIVDEYSDLARWAVACLAHATLPDASDKETAQARESANEAVQSMIELEGCAEGIAARAESVLVAVEAIGVGSSSRPGSVVAVEASSGALAGAELVTLCAAARARAGIARGAGAASELAKQASTPTGVDDALAAIYGTGAGPSTRGSTFASPPAAASIQAMAATTPIVRAADKEKENAAPPKASSGAPVEGATSAAVLQVPRAEPEAASASSPMVATAPVGPAVSAIAAVGAGTVPAPSSATTALATSTQERLARLRESMERLRKDAGAPIAPAPSGPATAAPTAEEIRARLEQASARARERY